MLLRKRPLRRGKRLLPRQEVGIGQLHIGRAGKAAIETECLVVGVEHRLRVLSEVDAHKRHESVRWLHVRCIDRQRPARKGDRIVAPIEV